MKVTAQAEPEHEIPCRVALSGVCETIPGRVLLKKLMQHSSRTLLHYKILYTQFYRLRITLKLELNRDKKVLVKNNFLQR